MNTEWAFIAEILIGVGIATQLAGWFTQLWTAWSTYVGIILTFGAAAIYVWGVLKWNDGRIEPTAKTLFRSWRVNFINFWVAVGVTVVNIVFSWVFKPLTTDMWVFYGLNIATFVGAALIGAGVFMGWRMKNLWYTYDPTGSLKDEEFDYFKWTDMEGDGSTQDMEEMIALSF